MGIPGIPSPHILDCMRNRSSTDVILCFFSRPAGILLLDPRILGSHCCVHHHRILASDPLPPNSPPGAGASGLLLACWIGEKPKNTIPGRGFPGFPGFRYSKSREKANTRSLLQQSFVVRTGICGINTTFSAKRTYVLSGAPISKFSERSGRAGPGHRQFNGLENKKKTWAGRVHL